MSKGHHGSGPKTVKAPDPEMKNIEQSNALSTQKSRNGLLSTMLGAKVNDDTLQRGNAFAFTGKEYATRRDEYLATVAKPKKGSAWEGAKTAAKIAAGSGLIGGAIGKNSASRILGNTLGFGVVGGLIGYHNKKKAIDKAYNDAMNAYNAGLDSATNDEFAREEKTYDPNNVQNTRKKNKSTATSDLLGESDGK